MTYAAREAVNAFTPTFQFPVGTAQEREPAKEFQRAFMYRQSAPLWALSTKTKRYKVSRPIKVHIYAEGNLFFAENETLVVVGAGNSVSEAMEELSQHIIHFYQYYKKLSTDKVTGDAVRLKKIYETLFLESK
jgi:hypothetical protein